MNTRNFGHALLLSCLLAGCGGGSNSTPTPASTPTPTPTPTSTTTTTPPPATTPPPPPATTPPPPPPPSSSGLPLPGIGSTTPYVGPQGIFSLPINQPGFDSSTIVILDTGEIYGMDFLNGAALSFYHGVASGTSTGISSSMTDYGSVLGGPVNVSLSATFTNPAFAATIGFSFGTYSASTPGQLMYTIGDTHSIYGNPIMLASLAGTYNGEFDSIGNSVRNTSVSGLLLSSNGTFTVTTANCTFAGTLSQHGSTGTFDAVAQVTGAGCALAGNMKGLMMPLAYSPRGTSLGFQLLSTDATMSALLYVSK